MMDGRGLVEVYTRGWRGEMRRLSLKLHSGVGYLSDFLSGDRRMDGGRLVGLVGDSMGRGRGAVVIETG